jgi:hypothetical protein
MMSLVVSDIESGTDDHATALVDEAPMFTNQHRGESLEKRLCLVELRLDYKLTLCIDEPPLLVFLRRYESFGKTVGLNLLHFEKRISRFVDQHGVHARLSDELNRADTFRERAVQDVVFWIDDNFAGLVYEDMLHRTWGKTGFAIQRNADECEAIGERAATRELRRYGPLAGLIDIAPFEIDRHGGKSFREVGPVLEFRFDHERAAFVDVAVLAVFVLDCSESFGELLCPNKLRLDYNLASAIDVTPLAMLLNGP